MHNEHWLTSTRLARSAHRGRIKFLRGYVSKSSAAVNRPTHDHAASLLICSRAIGGKAAEAHTACPFAVGVTPVGAVRTAHARSQADRVLTVYRFARADARTLYLYNSQQIHLDTRLPPTHKTQTQTLVIQPSWSVQLSLNQGNTTILVYATMASPFIAHPTLYFPHPPQKTQRRLLQITASTLSPHISKSMNQLLHGGTMMGLRLLTL